MNAALQLDGDGELELSSTHSNILNHIFCTFCHPQHFFRLRLPGLVAVRCESQIETEILLLVLTSRHELWIFFIHTNITSVKWDIVAERSPPQSPAATLCQCYGCRRPGPQLSPPPTRRWWSWPPASHSVADKAITGAQSGVNWPNALSVGMPSSAPYTPFTHQFHTQE